MPNETAERLRLAAKLIDPAVGRIPPRLFNEGADEIERLAAENAALRARLAEAEALLREATMLLFDWDALVGGTESHATETQDFLERVGYDHMTATLRKADSASDCAHEWVNASNFEPGPNERCMKCNAIRRIADQPSVTSSPSVPKTR